MNTKNQDKSILYKLKQNYKTKLSMGMNNEVVNCTYILQLWTSNIISIIKDILAHLSTLSMNRLQVHVLFCNSLFSSTPSPLAYRILGLKNKNKPGLFHTF